MLVPTFSNRYILTLKLIIPPSSELYFGCYSIFLSLDSLEFGDLCSQYIFLSLFKIYKFLLIPFIHKNPKKMHQFYYP